MNTPNVRCRRFLSLRILAENELVDPCSIIEGSLKSWIQQSQSAFRVSVLSIKDIQNSFYVRLKMRYSPGEIVFVQTAEQSLFFCFVYA